MKLKDEFWSIYRQAYKIGEIPKEEEKIIKKIYVTEGRESIYEAARTKKLVPAVARLMCKLNLDQDFWKPITDNYRDRNNKIIKCMDEMYAILQKNGVNHIAVVENFGALLSSNEDLCMFGSGDADEYADPFEKDKIYQILIESGYEISEVKIGNLLISSSIKKNTFPDNFYFGINWDLTNRINLPSISTNGKIINWETCYYYKNTNIRLPSAESLMYICLMHIAVHGFCKAPDIRLYYDVANVAQNNVNWSVIADWAKKDNNCVRLSVAAYLANCLLDVDIPQYIYSLGNERQRKKLLSIVYNKHDNRLNDFPGKKERLLIDVYSHDKGAFAGLKEILFPDSDWLKLKFGSVIIGNIKHICKLI